MNKVIRVISLGLLILLILTLLYWFFSPTKWAIIEIPFRNNKPLFFMFVRYNGEITLNIRLSSNKTFYRHKNEYFFPYAQGLSYMVNNDTLIIYTFGSYTKPKKFDSSYKIIIKQLPEWDADNPHIQDKFLQEVKNSHLKEISIKDYYRIVSKTK